jgi:hypothetical protein
MPPAALEPKRLEALLISTPFMGLLPGVGAPSMPFIGLPRGVWVPLPKPKVVDPGKF